MHNPPLRPHFAGRAPGCYAENPAGCAPSMLPRIILSKFLLTALFAPAISASTLEINLAKLPRFTGCTQPASPSILRSAGRKLEGVSIPMKRSLAVALFLSAGMALHAQTSSPAAASSAGSSKVAVIAFQEAVTQTNEFQRDFADLQKKFEPKRQQLKTESDEIETLTKQLQTQGATLSEAQRTARTNAISEKKKQLQRDAEDAQGDFQQQMEDTFKGVAAKFYPVMQSYATQQGYSLVLDASQQSSPILFAVQSANITKPVLEAYNQKSGIPAPPPAAPAPHASTGASHPAPRPAAHR